jgi:hypothetical protein
MGAFSGNRGYPAGRRGTPLQAEGRETHRCHESAHSDELQKPSEGHEPPPYALKAARLSRAPS